MACGTTLSFLLQGGLGDQNEFSGTTFVATVVRGDMLWCANCGDSRLIVAVQEGGCLVAKDVSEDHKPDAPAEKARIVAAGGRVFAVRDAAQAHSRHAR
jgi:serine/threonine protein phosphatase PrpC